jgi:hypothetical protein
MFPPRLNIMVAILCATFCIGGSGELTVAAEPSGKEMSVGECLGVISAKVDCYFTLEYKPVNSYCWSLLSKTIRFNDKAPINASDEAVLLLRDSLREFTITTSPLTPNIIHIIDKRLTPQMLGREYVLDKTTPLIYSGVTQDLPSILGKRLHVGLRRMDWTPGDKFGIDEYTKISFTAKETSLRRMLTDHLPLSQLSRVLWLAETRADETVVRYLGQIYRGPRPEFSYNHEPFPFSYGERAFAANCHLFKKDSALGTDITTLAIQFIDDEVKKKRPLNVRWAMFFLGECKCKEGIAPLIKHIDYCYTTYPILEESYPAVRALTQIGAPAASATGFALFYEHNDLRLRLLCHTILRIDGIEKGEKRIKEILPYVKDEAQAKRVQAALKQALAEQR